MAVTRSVVFSQNVTQVYVVLVEITHPILANPIRVVNNDEDLTHNGVLYTRGYMSLVLPSMDEGERSASVTIQNVDDRIGKAAQTLIGPATIKFKVVRTDAPDNVEVEYPTMRIANISGDAMTIQGNIVSNHEKGEPYPKVTTNKTTSPGLFL